MAYEVIPTHTYKIELDDALRYHIEVLGTVQGARSLVAAIKRARTLLADNPELKALSSKPALKKMGFREWCVKNYVIVYRLGDEVVYLEHLFHQSQDFENLL